MARGHTRKRGNGYSVVIELPRNPAQPHKRRQKWFAGFRTRREADTFLTQKLRELDTGVTVTPSEQTLAAYLADWIAKRRAAGKLRASTVEEYGYKIARHIAPAIGALPLGKITPLHIDNWLAALRAKGLAEGTVANIYSLVHGGLKAAVKLRLLALNPCDAVESPSPREKRRVVWDDEQARHFRDLLADEPLRLAFLLVLGTGLRKGEVLGLRWSDVDLARGTIAVRQQQTYTVEHKIAYADPKTDAGQRAMKLPPFALSALRAERAQSKGEGNVLRDRHGTPLHMHQLEWAWQRVRRRAVAAGLPSITFHDLRHVHATVALVAGVAPKVLSKRLGHTRISTTYDMYVYVPDSLDAHAADQIGEIFGGDVPPD